MPETKDRDLHLPETQPGPIEAAGPARRPLSRRAFLGLLGLGALGLGGLGWLSRSFAGARALGRATAGKGWHDYLSAAPPHPDRLTMIIDLKKLTPEKARAIQSACRLAHNTPWGREDLAWVKLKEAGRIFAAPPPLALKAIPTFCHHCDYPLCVSVCPTGATFKRPNGLVAQDPHRCLGCRFCQKTCPFEARVYNSGPLEPRPAAGRHYPLWGQGTVAKCNFCEDRPSATPACLEAVPEALAFGPRRRLAPELARALSPTAGHPARAVSLGPNLYYLV